MEWKNAMEGKKRMVRCRKKIERKEGRRRLERDD